MKNICLVAGARPNFIKLAPLIRAIQASQETQYKLVYAGREDDPTLEPTLFEDLQMPLPDVYLGVDSTSLNEITSRVMAQFDAYLNEYPTDVVIVVDDLASTMAAAIVTKKRGVKLAHLVAGTRSFDINMPKEINRLVIDSLSDYLFTAGVKSNSVAARSQGDGSETYMVGNILMDTLRYNLNRLKRPQIDIQEDNYFVLTINRKMLLADKEQLKSILEALITAAGDIPIIAPLRAEAHETILNLNKTIRVVDPMSYLEFGWLTAHAKGIITDSGNVAEEATFNNIPCITLNNYTEHQETVTIGSNELIGGNPQSLSEAVGKIIRKEWKSSSLPERWDGRTAERILKILLSD